MEIKHNDPTTHVVAWLALQRINKLLPFGRFESGNCKPPRRVLENLHLSGLHRRWPRAQRIRMAGSRAGYHVGVDADRVHE